MSFSRDIAKLLVFLAALLLLPASVSAQTFTDLIDFTDSSFGSPGYVSLAQGRDGNLYGTTAAAPITGTGTVFSTTPLGTVKMEFGGFDWENGAHPEGSLTLAPDGTFYGTTEFSNSAGVIFNITSNADYTVVHQFQGDVDGSYPIAPPILGTDGFLYGTTTGYPHGLPSTVYKYDPSTGTVTLLHSFGKSVGLYWALTQGIDGDLYGVALQGGPNKLGSIFRMTTSGLLRYVYNFPGGDAGQNPNGPLVQLNDGNFYGTASFVGTASGGIVFKMTPGGDISIIHNFNLDDPNGWAPITGLTLGSDGLLYGFANAGGSNNYGVIYRLTTSGNYTALYNLTAYSATLAPLTQHTNGMFYGVASYGGANNFGMVYRFDCHLKPFISLVQPQGHAGQTIQILGQGLSTATKVTFNGKPALTFAVVSDTYMTAVVPNGATTGVVKVSSPANTLMSNRIFRITP